MCDASTCISTRVSLFLLMESVAIRLVYQQIHHNSLLLLLLLVVVVLLLFYLYIFVFLFYIIMFWVWNSTSGKVHAIIITFYFLRASNSMTQSWTISKKGSSDSNLLSQSLILECVVIRRSTLLEEWYTRRHFFCSMIILTLLISLFSVLY